MISVKPFGILVEARGVGVSPESPGSPEFAVIAGIGRAKPYH